MKALIIDCGGSFALAGLNKRFFKSFETEDEAKEYARQHKFKLPPFKKTWLEKHLDKHPELQGYKDMDGVYVSPGGFWPDGRRIMRPDLYENREDEKHLYFINEQQRVTYSNTQNVVPLDELELIYKVACRAILLSPALKEKTNVLYVASAIEICHVLHYRLRLAEMAGTSDGSRLLHDIWLIIRSIDQETSSWDNVGSPKFSENTPKEGR